LKVLITGSTGFVGSHFLTLLKQHPHFEIEEMIANLCQPEALAAGISATRFDALVHLAAQSSVARSMRDSRTTYETNVIGSLNLLEALSAKGFRGKVLFVSSSEVYGDPGSAAPIPESATPRPTHAYGVSKLAAEGLFQHWCASESLPLVIARPFLHVGTGQASTFVISSLAHQVASIKMGRQEPVITAGDLTVARDVTDVRDVVRAYCNFLEQDVSGTFNICSGTAHRLADMAAQLIEIGGVKAEIMVDDSRVRAVNPQTIVGDASAIRQAVGWTPRIPMSQTLRDMIQDWEMRLRG